MLAGIVAAIGLPFLDKLSGDVEAAAAEQDEEERWAALDKLEAIATQQEAEFTDNNFHPEAERMREMIFLIRELKGESVPYEMAADPNPDETEEQ